MWQQLFDFLYNQWFKIGMLVWMFYLVSPMGRDWFKEQIEWVKGLFYDDDDEVQMINAPSHKNAILIALATVFCVAFLRKIAMTTTGDVPDVPAGWQLVLLAGLGIAATKSAAQKLIENKWGANKEVPKP